MTTRETGATASDRDPQGTNQRHAEFSGVAGAPQINRIPRKWQRVLAAFLTGRSFNRFDSERDLSDHCLHSTVSEIESKGVKIRRQSEQVPGYQNIPTDVKRYWLDPSDVESVTKARELLSAEPKATRKAARETDAAEEAKRQRAMEQERRFRAQRVPA